MKKDVEELKEYCEFGEDRVYVLMAIARSKENEEHSSNTEPTMREVVRNEEELAQKINQLEHAAGGFGDRFRLYISANARDVMKASFKLRNEMDKWLEMRLNSNEGVKKKFKKIDSEFKSVLQKNECRDDSKFIFDLDDAGIDDFQELRDDIENFTSIELTRETPNGFHIVAEPFNYNEMKTGTEYELKKDGMVFLDYIGE